MNYSYTAKELSQIFQHAPQHIEEQQRFPNFSTDTRTLQPGELFFCLQGEQFDGHRFAADALKKGASAIVANPEFLDLDQLPNNAPYFPVTSPNDALMMLARDYRQKYHGTVIGITGSNGKTSSKEILAQLIQLSGKTVHATPGNFNNHIGVPLSILSANLDEAYWVLEMGTNHPGEIKVLSETIAPHASMISSIGESHLEFFGTVERVAEEKADILRGMTSGGTLLLPLEAAGYPVIYKKAAEQNIQVKTYSFNTTSTADYTVAQYSIQDNRAYFELEGISFETQITYPILLQNLLGTLLTLHLAGWPLKNLVDAVSQLELTASGRLEAIQMPSFLLIDDSYNANPSSFESVVKSLKLRYPERPLIVLAGKMAEVGSTKKDIMACHQHVGQLLSDHVDDFIAYGEEEALAYQQGWQQQPHASSSHIVVTHDAKKVIHALESRLTSHSIVLVKGSRAAHMEKIVKDIKCHFADSSLLP